MYSSLDSGPESSNRTADEMKVREQYGEDRGIAKRMGGNKVLNKKKKKSFCVSHEMQSSRKGR